MSHDRFPGLAVDARAPPNTLEEMTHVQSSGQCPGSARPLVATAAQVVPFPGDFRTQEITTDDGAAIYVRTGGQGPAVVLLHGFGDTGDMWAPLAATFARDYTVVVPDLRGMGLSSHPAHGYDKRTQAADIRAVLTHLGIKRAALSGMISAPWSPMPMPPAIPIRPRSWW